MSRTVRHALGPTIALLWLCTSSLANAANDGAAHLDEPATSTPAAPTLDSSGAPSASAAASALALTSSATVPGTAPMPTARCPSRPTILFNRWQEDWSVLADACVPRRPFDELKYIALSADPHTYLSLGANLRERFELNNAPLFGTGAGKPDSYLIQRAEVHADLRVGEHWQVFAQLEDARAFDKTAVSAVDQNPLDLEQAFATWVGSVGDGTFKFRAGRQEMAFDLQRFISVRDGPNVRQAYDGLWADYEIGKWRLIGFATRPVQYRDVNPFDDVSNRDLTFSGVRFERQSFGPGDVSGYYARYGRSGAHWGDATGTERRDVFDMRYTGKRDALDWDIESMLQSGHIGNTSVFAWALGSLAGYTLGLPWSPRLGLQIDAASGDQHPGDGHLGTFNPLFPNGYYFTLAGYTGYSNLIHIKPSLTLKPSSTVSLLAALGFQWRESTADAVYAQGSTAVPGTAGKGGMWTGAYAQVRADWLVAANVTTSLEAVHFQVSDDLKAAGGRNADYLGVEMKLGW